MYRHNIYDEIIERISIFNPKVTDEELKRIRRSLWVIFDGINSHNGELSDVEIRPNFRKRYSDFEEEILRSHTEKGFDKNIMPATIEGSLIRMCDKTAYTIFDMLDGIYEGFIPGIEGDYTEVLRELGVTREEIITANLRRNYEKIARKVQIIFAKSLIENSSKDAIRMDIKTARIMHELRSINNREIINLQLLQEDQETYPYVIETLMNRFADLIIDTVGSVRDLKYAASDNELAGTFIEKFKGTPDEGFAEFITTTTPKIYSFNEKMIKMVEKNEMKVGKLTEIDFNRKMALEFGAEYLSTLCDYEFLDLGVSQGIITDTKKQSLTRKYKDIGREGLLRERYVSKEKQKMISEQNAEIAKMKKEERKLKTTPDSIGGHEEH